MTKPITTVTTLTASSAAGRAAQLSWVESRVKGQVNKTS